MSRDRLTTDSVVDKLPPKVISKVAAKKADSDRDLSGAPEYDKTKVSHLFKMLAQVSTALEATQGVNSEILSVPSDSISPDGKLGGKGYVMPIKELKEDIGDMSTKLSNIRDTLADELNNPGWGLSDEEKTSITKVQEDAGEKTNETIDEISEDVTKIFGDDEETGDLQEDTPEDEENDLVKDVDDFPSFTEEVEDAPVESEEKEEEGEIKTASSSNIIFKGIDKHSDKVTRKLASSVLTGLVKSCAKGTSK